MQEWVNEAGALARQIGLDITRHNKRQLQKIGTKHNSKELWKAVRQLTGHARYTSPNPSRQIVLINTMLPTDVSYEWPPPKDTAAERPEW